MLWYEILFAVVFFLLLLLSIIFFVIFDYIERKKRQDSFQDFICDLVLASKCGELTEEQINKLILRNGVQL